jgi:glycosyltransferase involved in cell wall biosynthesis
VQAVDRKLEILIVDDGSTDGTREVLEELAGAAAVRVFLQERNRGKGAALRRAFEAARNDIVIVQDADLEYDPAHYEELVKPIEAGWADAVYGSRYLPGPGRVPPFWHTQLNRFLTTLSNALNDLCLTDMETCYKVFRREVIQRIELTSNRFGFEPEITAKLARLGCVIYEVPIRYDRRSYDRGKKITWRDGVAALWHILRFSLSRRPVCKDDTLSAESSAPVLEPRGPGRL